jgi:hypothetical protein
MPILNLNKARCNMPEITPGNLYLFSYPIWNISPPCLTQCNLNLLQVFVSPLSYTGKVISKTQLTIINPIKNEKNNFKL